MSARNTSNHSRLSLKGGNSRIGCGTKKMQSTSKPEESKKDNENGADVADFEDLLKDNNDY